MIIQLKILSGKQAGAVMAARRFPFRIGRAASDDLRIEDNGVWDSHLQIEFKPRTGFFLNAKPEAITSVNGDQIQTSTALRNGDMIQLGSAAIQFWLGEVRQRGTRFRDSLIWATIAAISIGQIALIYWMMKE